MVGTTETSENTAIQEVADAQPVDEHPVKATSSGIDGAERKN